MKILIISFILILLILSIYADTYITAGQVSSNWILQDSPFYIEGEINVPVGETLVIEVGVEIIFNGHYKFLVYGYLGAIGTEADSITFTSANTIIGWHGLRFTNAQDFSHLSSCIIQYGTAAGASTDSEGGEYIVTILVQFSNTI